MFGGFGTSLILNSVVIYPITRKILLARNRIPKIEHRKLLAILFLTFIGLASVGLDLYQILWDRNLFKIMQVPRTAGDKEVRVAYQRLARELHPDRNPENPLAQEQFVEMKQAYDILANPQLRDTYDKWGYDGLRWVEKGDDVLSQGLFQMGITYVIWFALTVLLTVNTSHTHSRSISMAGLSVILAIDLHLKTSEFGWSIPLFSHIAVYQLTSLLFTIYPTYIGGTIVFQSFTYVDPVARNWKLLEAIFFRQNQLMENLIGLEQELRLTFKLGGAQSSAHIPATSTMNPTSTASGLPRNLQQKNNNAEVQQPKKKSSIPSWVFMIGFYILFNYVLK